MASHDETPTTMADVAVEEPSAEDPTAEEVAHPTMASHNEVPSSKVDIASEEPPAEDPPAEEVIHLAMASHDEALSTKADVAVEETSATEVTHPAMASNDEVPSTKADVAAAEPSVEDPSAEEPSSEAPAAAEVDQTPVSPLEEGKSNGGYASGGDACPSGPEDGDGEETLEHATELFEKGSKAIEDGDFVEAVDCLSRALEIRAANYGELAPECASFYYKYGCALLYKAQEETDPLGDVLKNTPKSSVKDASATNLEDGGSSVLSSDSKTPYSSSNNHDTEVSDVKKDDVNEGSDVDDEELEEADEDDSDLDLAWKMLDIARAIVEKHPEDSIEKVNIYAALGEVSMEREDVENSLSDYRRALAILERLVEPDNRRVVELNFRLCMVLELGSQVEEAIPYCEKAILLCKSQIKRLTESSAESKDTEKSSEKSVSDLDTTGQEIHSETSKLDSEIEVLSGILTELEKKVEDLQQLLSNPKSILTDLLKRNASTSTAAEKFAPRDFSRSSSVNSSQMAAIESGGFDSPTISTAANDSVTHLGVVGRGVKRAIVTPTGAEPSLKKSESPLSVEKADSNVSEVLSNPLSSEASNK